MQYGEFHDAIQKYGELFSTGMKSDANKWLTSVVSSLDTLPPQEFESVLSCFSEELCETSDFDFLFRRGNFQIPFQLKKPILQYLQPLCEKKQMPQLRWFWQIFKNDTECHEKAYSFLANAYQSPDCDTKTLEFVFQLNVDILSYGAHEMPIGLLISKEDYEQIVKECEDILNRITIGDSLVSMYRNLLPEYEEYR